MPSSIPHAEGLSQRGGSNELASAEPPRLGRGFGAEVSAALALRQQWLVEQERAHGEGDGVRMVPGAVARLRQRELMRVAGQLSRELQLAYLPAASGEPVERRLAHAVQVGDRKFALIERFGPRLDRQSRTAERTERKLEALTELVGVFVQHQLT